MNQELSNDILLFIEVINAGSFIAAGKQLGLSKPTVSRRINQLEAQLKTKLIKRSTRKLSLTEAGQILYQRCYHLSSGLSAAIQEITDLHQRPMGELRIGVSSYFANDFRASKIIAEFMKMYPGISVQFHSFTASNDVDLIKHNFHLYFTDNDMTNTSLQSSLLCQYPVKLCAAPAYIQTHGKPNKLEDLKDYNCLLHFLYEKPIKHWYIEEKNREINVEVDGNFYASRTHLLLKMARAGQGIACLPEFMIDKDLKSGALISLLDTYKVKPAEVYITTYREKNLAKKVKSFIKYVKSQWVF